MSATPSSASEHPVPLNVLVVDDTATNRQIMAVFLKKLGHTVEMAEDGSVAVEKFGLKPYDMILMDVMMPVMDGYEATRRIKAMCGERWVPVIFLSALDKDENLVAGLEAGGDDYLPKPVNFVILEAKLRSLTRTLLLRREVDDARRLNQAVADNLMDAIITADEKGIIASVNPAASRIFGYARTELVGQNLSLLMPEPMRSEHDGYLARYLGGEAPRMLGAGVRDVEGQRKDGSIVPLSIGISEFRDRGQRMFVGALRDVSVQRAAERKMREDALALKAHHDEREAENALAADIFGQLMKRPGLSDPVLQYWMSPAGHFSGDIAAAARVGGGRYYAMLADATGHGLGAAISVLPVLTLFYDIVEFGLSLGRIVAKINEQLRGALPVGRFVACAGVCVDQQQQQVEVWLGGMPAVLLLDTEGEVVHKFSARNLPLGIDDIDWRRAAGETVPIPPGGGQLVLVSDGLLEAENPAGESFGFERLRNALAGSPADKRREAVQTAVFNHLDGRIPHDDVTLMLIDLAPGGPAT